MQPRAVRQLLQQRPGALRGFLWGVDGISGARGGGVPVADKLAHLAERQRLDAFDHPAVIGGQAPVVARRARPRAPCVTGLLVGQHAAGDGNQRSARQFARHRLHRAADPGAQADPVRARTRGDFVQPIEQQRHRAAPKRGTQVASQSGTHPVAVQVLLQKLPEGLRIALTGWRLRQGIGDAPQRAEERNRRALPSERQRIPLGVAQMMRQQQCQVDQHGALAAAGGAKQHRARLHGERLQRQPRAAQRDVHWQIVGQIRQLRRFAVYARESPAWRFDRAHPQDAYILRWHRIRRTLLPYILPFRYQGLRLRNTYLAALQHHWFASQGEVGKDVRQLQHRNERLPGAGPAFFGHAAEAQRRERIAQRRQVIVEQPGAILRRRAAEEVLDGLMGGDVSRLALDGSDGRTAGPGCLAGTGGAFARGKLALLLVNLGAQHRRNRRYAGDSFERLP